MDVQDRVPEIVVHVGEGLVAEDTGIVDHDIDAAKGINSSLDDLLTIFSGGLDTDGLATKLLDLSNHGLRSINATNTSTTACDKSDTAGEVGVLALLSRTHLHRVLKQCEEIVGTCGILGVGVVDDLTPVLNDSSGGVRVVSLEEETTGALPSKLSHVATANLKDTTSLLCVVLVNQDSDEGNNPFGLELLEDIRRHDGLGHSAGSYLTRNNIGQDTILDTLLGQSLCETDHGELGSGVVGLTKVAKEASSRRGVDDTADTGVVDEDIDSAEGADGGLNDALAVLY
ncbi:hypothetical protein HG531_010314 [Fusarium graminearum]|nr:hypothetical protein HG531_010314 [Fusarium graminearum]